MDGLSRKTVTVLFSDVVDSTPLGEAVDPESVRELMGRYFEGMRAVIERHGGTVEKYIGDEIMAVFGIPVVHEDDALRAVRASCEMREALGFLNRDLPRTLSVRTALNTGEVVAGDRHTLVTGDVVNTAARLRGAAAAGEILVGAPTYDLVRDAVVAEPVEPLELKGKASPVGAWRLTAVVPDAPGRARRLDSDLVGRQTELALLRQAYARAVGSSSCHLFTLLGTAGVGKSRLVNGLLTEVSPEARTLVGRCLSYGEGITYWPLRDLVHPLGGLDTFVAAAEADAIRGALGAGGGTASKEEIFRAVRKLIEALAAERPVVIGFDDVHWAEPTFLDLIDHLAETIREAPVLLVCIARPELLDERPGWAGGKLNATTILLEPLDVDESHQLLDNLGGGDIAPALRRTITEVAEGNPLFIEEMVALAIEDPAASTVPPTIHALLTARLERLDPAERSVLAAASVAGRFFTRAAVTELVGDDVEVGEQLASLARKELIRAQPVPFARGDGYRFRHVLIRDAAYDALPKGERARMHQVLADWLPASGDEAEELVGWHLEQSARYRAELGAAAPELARRASLALGAAGRRALARDDARAAVALLGRASSILEDADSERAALLAELGSALMKTGDFTRADEVLADAMETGDARTCLRARVDREFVRSFLHPEAGSESLRRVADEVIPKLEELRDDLGLAKAWWLLSEAHSIACRWELRAAALERAIHHARRAHTSEQAGAFVALLAQALYYGPTPVGEALARCEALVAEYEGNRALEVALASTLAGLHAMLGEFGEARRLWGEAAANYEDLGLHFRRAARSLLAAEIELLAGDPPAAERELRSGYETLERMGERGVRSTVSAFLARTLVTHGRFDDAAPYIRFSAETAAADDLVTQIVLLSAQAEANAQDGGLAAAESLARDAIRLGETTDFLVLQAEAQLSLAVVLHAAGRADEADDARRRAIAIFERKGNRVAARRASALRASPRR